VVTAPLSDAIGFAAAAIVLGSHYRRASRIQQQNY
jgi:hypothetical protein